MLTSNSVTAGYEIEEAPSAVTTVCSDKNQNPSRRKHRMGFGVAGLFIFFVIAAACAPQTGTAPKTASSPTLVPTGTATPIPTEFPLPVGSEETLAHLTPPQQEEAGITKFPSEFKPDEVTQFIPIDQIPEFADITFDITDLSRLYPGAEFTIYGTTNGNLGKDFKYLPVIKVVKVDGTTHILRAVNHQVGEVDQAASALSYWIAERNNVLRLDTEKTTYELIKVRRMPVVSWANPDNPIVLFDQGKDPITDETVFTTAFSQGVFFEDPKFEVDSQGNIVEKYIAPEFHIDLSQGIPEIGEIAGTIRGGEGEEILSKDLAAFQEAMLKNARENGITSAQLVEIGYHGTMSNTDPIRDFLPSPESHNFVIESDNPDTYYTLAVADLTGNAGENIGKVVAFLVANNVNPDEPFVVPIIILDEIQTAQRRGKAKSSPRYNATFSTASNEVASLILKLNYSETIIQKDTGALYFELSTLGKPKPGFESDFDPITVIPVGTDFYGKIDAEYDEAMDAFLKKFKGKGMIFSHWINLNSKKYPGPDNDPATEPIP